MTKEDLLKLKEKLSKLDEQEKKQRDLYLRGLASGEIQGPPVGHASIDKPWLKYYSESKVIEDAPKLTCYRNLYENNKNNLDDVAIEYYGNKITYRELFENIDKTAQAFQTQGIKKGDIITICSVTTPEIIYAFYALNKIGAISNMIDPRYPKKAISNYLKEVNSKCFITLDLVYPKVGDILDDSCVDKTIVFSPTNSIPKPLKIISGIVDTFKGKKVDIPYSRKIVDWNDFIKKRNDIKVDEAEYVDDFPAAIVHTGGTTGTPKGVVLTNSNFNNGTIQMRASAPFATRGYRYLNIMPPFIAYGIILGLTAPITLGWHTIVVPQFDANKFDQLLLKHKPNGIIGVPAYWESVMKSKKIKDLSFVKNVLLGGDKTKAEFEKRLGKYLNEHNSNADIGKGYSMTEAGACGTFSTREANELDSVGIPLSKTTISAFKPGTNEELSYGEVGEIYIKTPTAMKEYFENPSETDKVKVKHEDGYWIHSGDLGYINKDGIVFIKDRIKRMIIRSGFKVFPSEIENLFLTHPGVECCTVVGIPDDVEVSVPKVHLVLKQDYIGKEDVVREQLKEMFINSDLPSYFEPVSYKFRDSIPLTNLGKVDFISLIEEEKVNEMCNENNDVKTR